MFTIIITTYNRTELAAKTIEGLLINLVDTDRQWILADDGSDEGHLETLYGVFPHDEIVHVTQAGRQGVGKSKNIALEKAFETSPYVLLLEDDWYLAEPLSLAPHMRIMDEHFHVGMIRFGFLGTMPHENFTGIYRDYGNFHAYWELQPRSAHYIYSGQVSLRHKRYYDFVGYHAEGLAAGEEEEDMCRRYANASQMNWLLHNLDTINTMAPMLPLNPSHFEQLQTTYRRITSAYKVVPIPTILWPAEYGCTMNAGPFKNIGLDSSLNAVAVG